MAVATWTCPNCKRRVPGAVPVCRCGLPRPALAPAGPATTQAVPWQVKAWLVVLVLAAVAGLFNLFRHHTPTPIAPVLGYMDHPPPTPAPPSGRPRR